MRRVDYLVGKHDFKTLKAEQFMQDNVFAYQLDDTGDTLANVMTEYGFGSVPVIDDHRRVLGIVTEFDLLKILLEERELTDVKASDLMTPSPITVFPDTPAMDIIRLLEERHLIRMPVVDQNNILKGIVSRRDVLQGFVNATRKSPVF
jgi:CBS domain-containing protein